MMTVGRRVIFRLASGLSAVILAATGLVLAPGVAHADEGDPPPTPVPAGQRLDGLLERCYRREGEWLSTQAGNIDRAGEAISKAADLIEEARSRGVDTAEMEALLASADSQLAAARSQHDSAAGILAAHAGFDGNGAVVDREQARGTCLEARQALNDARQALVEVREIGVEMREIVRDWWRDHRPAPVTAE